MTIKNKKQNKTKKNFHEYEQCTVMNCLKKKKEGGCSRRMGNDSLSSQQARIYTSEPLLQSLGFLLPALDIRLECKNIIHLLRHIHTHTQITSVFPSRKYFSL